MEILGGKSDLLSGWFSDGSFFAKKPTVQLFQAGNLPPGYLQLTGANAANALPEFFGSVSGPKSRSLLTVKSTVSDAIPEKGLYDALKYVITGSDEQMSVFSAKGDLPGNISTDGTKGPDNAGFFQPIIDWLNETGENFEGLVGRAAIIILGFIFVGAGLSLFKQNPPAIPNVAKVVKGAI